MAERRNRTSSHEPSDALKTPPRGEVLPVRPRGKQQRTLSPRHRASSDPRKSRTPEEGAGAEASRDAALPRTAGMSPRDQGKDDRQASYASRQLSLARRRRERQVAVQEKRREIGQTEAKEANLQLQPAAPVRHQWKGFQPFKANYSHSFDHDRHFVGLDATGFGNYHSPIVKHFRRPPCQDDEEQESDRPGRSHWATFDDYLQSPTKPPKDLVVEITDLPMRTMDLSASALSGLRGAGSSPNSPPASKDAATSQSESVVGEGRPTFSASLGLATPPSLAPPTARRRPR